MIEKIVLMASSWAYFISVGLLIWMLARYRKRRKQLYSGIILLLGLTILGSAGQFIIGQRNDIRDILPTNNAAAMSQIQAEINRMGPTKTFGLTFRKSPNSHVKIMGMIWLKPSSALSFTTDPQKYETRTYSRFRTFRVKLDGYPTELVVFGALGRSGWEVMSTKPCEPKDLIYGSLLANDILRAVCCVE